MYSVKEGDFAGDACEQWDSLSSVPYLPVDSDTHRSRIRYLSKKNSRILTNFPKLKKIVKIRTKIR